MPGSSPGMTSAFSFDILNFPDRASRSRDPIVSELSQKSSPLNSEGAGNAGRLARPQPCVQKRKHASKSPRASPKRSGIPRANGFNGFLRALPGEPGFLATIIGAMRQHQRRLDASVGASGPHDFAVRNVRIRRARRHVHRIPRPTFGDDGQRPSVSEPRTREGVPVICPTPQAKVPATDWHDGQIGLDSGRVRSQATGQRRSDRVRASFSASLISRRAAWPRLRRDRPARRHLAARMPVVSSLT
jgi:hypothetical protein